MPIDACQFFYECRGCGALLKPKAGDCCVFCSYGDIPCPPIQEAKATGATAGCRKTESEAKPLEASGHEQPISSCCGGISAGWRPLNSGQRRARSIAGVVLLALAASLPWTGAGWITLTIVAGWFGATHVLAALMGYPGCPELGAVPSLLLGRWVKIGCTPWRWLDERLRLTT